MAATRHRAKDVARYGFGIALAVALLAVGVPRAAGVPWQTVATNLGAVPLRILALLAVVWFLGLVTHTIALTAAMPGLSHRRALTLSLTGSSVASVLPLGGLAGIALNYRMARSWGFDKVAFTTFTVVSNVWNVLGKLAVPVAAVVLVAVAPRTGVPLLRPVGLAAAAALALLVGLVVMTLRHSDRLRRGEQLWRTCRQVVHRGWLRLTTGVLVYVVALLLLLWLCLHVVGVTLPITAVLIGFAAERIATLANLTPGGVGVVELGLVGALVALGGDPAAVVSGVFLYRAFTFGMEIPVGGIWLVGWSLTRAFAGGRSRPAT